MTRPPLTLLAVLPEQPAWTAQLDRLRAQGALVAHTADPERARQWLATLLPDLLLGSEAALQALRPLLPGRAHRSLAFEGEPAQLEALLLPWFPQLREAGPRRFGPLEVDESRGEVCLDDPLRGPRRVHIPATELRLLVCLARHQGRAVSRGELLDEAWAPDARPQPRSVDQVVRRLRQLLQTVGLAGRLRSLRGLGYRLDLDGAA